MNRRHGWILLVCFLAGCSTHPLVDLCDFFKPGRVGPTKVQPYGGVAIPQGPIVPVAPVIPGVAPVPPAFPGGVIPPPVPLPGATQLQPPIGGDLFPPLPPEPPRPRP